MKTDKIDETEKEKLKLQILKKVFSFVTTTKRDILGKYQQMQFKFSKTSATEQAAFSESLDALSKILGIVGEEMEHCKIKRK